MPRGGKRTGAGRRPQDEFPRQSLTLTLREAVVKQLRVQAAERSCSLSELTNEILAAHFEQSSGIEPSPPDYERLLQQMDEIDQMTASEERA